MSLGNLCRYALALSMILYCYSFKILPDASFAHLFYLLVIILCGIQYRLKGYFKRIDSVYFYLTIAMISIVDAMVIIIQGRKISIARMLLYMGLYFMWALLLTPGFLGHVDKRKFCLLCHKIAVVGTVYLIIQTASYNILHIKLPNTINMSIIEINTEEAITAGYRPASFFSEPAYYSSYVICVIALLLFDKVEGCHKRKDCLLLTIGVLISASSAGIVLVVYLYIFWFLCNIVKKKGKITKSSIIVLFVLLIIIMIATINLGNVIDFLGTTGRALSNSINKLTRMNNSNRVGNSIKKLEQLSGWNIVMGVGIGNEYQYLDIETSNYINSIVRLILQTGYLGLGAYCIFILRVLLKHHDPLSFFLISVYVIKCCTGGALFSVVGIFILALVYVVDNDAKDKR